MYLLYNLPFTLLGGATQWLVSRLVLLAIPLSKVTLEGAKRMLACPLQPNEPLLVTLYRRLLPILPLAVRFPILVFCLPFLVGFAGFFRVDEIKNISLS